MAGLYRDRGIVLRSIKLGEADRIVTFLTEGRGKVRAVAKGVRKPKSRFGARLEPTSHLFLQLYEGRNLDVVTQAETIDANRALRETYGAFTQAIAMLEAVDHVAQEAEANIALYRMLAAALRTLAEDPVPAVSAAFFWKLLALEGLSPQLAECVLCGLAPPEVALVSFDLESGGVLCEGCRRGRAITPGALDLMQRILGGQLGAALNEPASPSTHEVEHLATEAMEHHLERRLRSITLLDRA
jgi:DNA repair protein RecO (recombination protein O)